MSIKRGNQSKKVIFKRKKSSNNEVNYSYLITPEDRISYCYKYKVVKNVRKITEIINVSYDYYYKDNWVTIIHYDSVHLPDILHQHQINNLESETYYEFSLNELIYVENLNEWMTTIQDHLRENYESYKKWVKNLRI